MRALIASPLLAPAWRFPLARLLGPRAPVVLLYHGIPAAAGATLSGATFERHIRFLKRHFDVLPPHDLDRSRHRGQRLRVILTFDDGLRNNAEVVAPILRKHNVPALFFVSSRHATAGKFLWFNYLWALERRFPGAQLRFRGTSLAMTPHERSASVQRLSAMLLALRRHPAAMYQAIDDELPPLADFVPQSELQDRYAGMTAEQVADLAADPLFTIGAHTVDHPFLTRCEPGEQRRQLQANREWIEAVSGRRCDTVAYPSGDYDAAVLELCKRVGFVRGYAVTARLDRQSPLDIPRVGIYSASTEALGFKMHWAGLLRACRVPIG